MPINKKYIKYLSVIIIVALISLLMVHCSNTSKKEAALGVTIYRYDDMFMSTFKQEIKLKAQDRLIVNLNDAANSQTTQFDQIKSLVAKNVDVLAINLVDTDVAEEVVDKYNKKDIPTIFFNREPNKKVIEENEHCWYIGTDSTEAGVLQGQIILDTWVNNPEWDKNEDGVIQYVMLMGERGHKDTLLRSQYVIETIEASGVETVALSKDFADWDSIKAKELIDEWSDSFEDQIELVISNNDAMGLGAIVSLQNNGYMIAERFVPVIGVDGIPEFLNKIKNGLAIGTVVNDAENQSKAMIELSMSIINNEVRVLNKEWESGDERILRIPYLPITSENINDYLKK